MNFTNVLLTHGARILHILCVVRWLRVYLADQRVSYETGN